METFCHVDLNAICDFLYLMFFFSFLLLNTQWDFLMMAQRQNVNVFS